MGCGFLTKKQSSSVVLGALRPIPAFCTILQSGRSGRTPKVNITLYGLTGAGCLSVTVIFLLLKNLTFPRDSILAAMTGIMMETFGFNLVIVMDCTATIRK